MKKISRAELRGTSLDEDCKKAQISKYEYGPKDNRCFCYGLINCENDEYLDKCRECKAFVDNAEPFDEVEND